MATNKNAQIRYLTLDRCFSNPRKNFTVALLLDECNKALSEVDPNSTGIQRRQLYDDINFMQDTLGYDAPIEKRKDGRYTYYFYEDRDFSITNQPINEQEAQQIKDTLITLSRFRGMPQFDWMDEMVTRLEQSFSLTSEEKVISFDENEYLMGRDYIGELYQAIVDKQSLSIAYQSYNQDEPIEMVIHPYHLKQYNKRWFLFALNDEYQNISNYPLDRIKSIAKSKVSYVPNASVNFEEYFEDVVGVSISPDKAVEKVILKIDASLMPYITTKPLHESQAILKEYPQEGHFIQLKVQLNYELESLILSYGDKIEVLEPQVLKERISGIVSRSAEQYAVL